MVFFANIIILLFFPYSFLNNLPTTEKITCFFHIILDSCVLDRYYLTIFKFVLRFHHKKKLSLYLHNVMNTRYIIMLYKFKLKT